MFDRFQLRWVGMRFSQFEDLFPVADPVHLLDRKYALQPGNFGKHPGNPLVNDKIGKYQVLNFRVFEYIPVIVLTDRRVDGYLHGTDLEQTHVDEDPFGAV